MYIHTLCRRLGSSKQLKPADNGIRPAEGLTSPKLPLIAIEPPAKEHNTDVMNQLVTHTQMVSMCQLAYTLHVLPLVYISFTSDFKVRSREYEQ